MGHPASIPPIVSSLSILEVLSPPMVLFGAEGVHGFDARSSFCGNESG